MCSLAIALLLWKGIKGRNLLRTIYFLPVITSLVVVAIVWSRIFDAQYGLINQLLKLIGINGPAWLYRPGWAMAAVIFTSIWKNAGFYAVIFLSGLHGIPDMYYECAKLDGANSIQQFFHITMPLLRRLTALVVVMLTLNSFKVFALVDVMTGGGPMRSTETIVNYLYRQGFQSLRMGYASAVAWVLFFVILLITLFQMKYIGGKRDAIGQ
jgi:multiple sugar transport system permease protein